MSHLAPFLQHHRPDLKTIHRQMWFDNSTIETHLDCNRLAWYNYNWGFESKSAAMAAGTVWHSGLEELHKTGNVLAANVTLAREYEKHKLILQAGANRHQFGTINDALHEYDRKYTGMTGIQYHEQEFKFGIWIQGSTLEPHHKNCPEGQCQMPNQPDSCFWLVGRFDGIITYNNDLLLLENKTTSQMGGTYLTGLDMSRQATTYVYAMKKILAANNYQGPPVKGVLFNVVKLGSEIGFLRHTVLRHEKQLQEFEVETIEAVAGIRASWNATIKPIKNTRSCNRYGECQFVDLCKAWSGRAKEDKPDMMNNFQVSGWRPY